VVSNLLVSLKANIAATLVEININIDQELIQNQENVKYAEKLLKSINILQLLRVEEYVDGN